MCTEDARTGMDRRDFLRIGGAGLAGAVLLGTTGGTALARTTSLRESFEAASKEYGVPVPLLLAMGYVNTLWEMPPPAASDYEPGDLHGRGAYGIMQLYQNPARDTLGRAAGLTKLPEERLKNERAANIRGGAAVLSGMVGASKPRDLDGWQEAVAEYGGIELYAQEVFRVLKNGVSATISTGESLRLAPRDVEVPVLITARAATDYGRAGWQGAHRSNYSNRDRGKAINKLIVHVAQGSVSGTVSWFKNASSNVSAHYIVGSEGRVVQCVRHEDIAWHAGNWAYNVHSIGIEHGGYADNRKTWTDAKYETSAKLAAYCCRRHGIKIDREHIVEHNQVPGTDHYCPGRHFDYDRYLRLIRKYR